MHLTVAADAAERRRRRPLGRRLRPDQAGVIADGRRDHTPAAGSSGVASVPGDKSIAHRWLILSATAKGSSRLAGLPRSLDVRSTAACLSKRCRRRLDLRSTSWLETLRAPAEGRGSTWNAGVEVPASVPSSGPLEVEGEGREALLEPSTVLDCGNSGTSMRLLAGVLAAAPFAVRPHGRSRACRSARWSGSPARFAGWAPPCETTDGPRADRASKEARCTVSGSTPELPERAGEERDPLRGARRRWHHRPCVSARPHARPHRTRARGARRTYRLEDGEVRVAAFPARRIRGHVPGDPSSAAFLIAAAALTADEAHDRRCRPQPEPAPLPRRDGADGDRDQSHGRGYGGRGARRDSIVVEPCEGLRAVSGRAGRVAAGDRRGAGARRPRGRTPRADVVVPRRGGAPGQGERPARGPSPRACALWAAPRPTRGTTSWSRGAVSKAARTTSGGDHRIAMAIAVAALGASGALEGRGDRGRRRVASRIRRDPRPARRADRGAVSPPVIVRSTARPGAGSRRSPAGSRAPSLAVRQHGLDVPSRSPRRRRLGRRPRRRRTPRRPRARVEVQPRRRILPSSRSRVTPLQSYHPGCRVEACRSVSRHPEVRDGDAPPAAGPRCRRGGDGGSRHRDGGLPGRTAQAVLGGRPRSSCRPARRRARSHRGRGARARCTSATRAMRAPPRSSPPPVRSRSTPRTCRRADPRCRARGGANVWPSETCVSGVPQIAVVGRQNVGKSTLVNRLFGQREAIAHERPESRATGRGRGHVARPSVRSGRHRRLPPRAAGLEALAAEQADTRDRGCGPDPARGRRHTRASPRTTRPRPTPADAPRPRSSSSRTRSTPTGDDADVADLYRLGLGEPFPVSALHGRGVGRPARPAARPAARCARSGRAHAAEPRFALVGRPNVGKSSACSTGWSARSARVVYEEPGTTRDAVDSLVTWPDAGPSASSTPPGCAGHEGARRRVLQRAARPQAIERAHVAVLVLDAAEGSRARTRRSPTSSIGRRPRACSSSRTNGIWSRTRTGAFKRPRRRRLQLFAEGDGAADFGDARHRACTGSPPFLIDLHDGWNLAGRRRRW